MADDTIELSPQQRAAVVAFELGRGRALRTRDIMRLTGLSRSGALAMMAHLECIGGIPIRYCEDEQLWRVVSLDEGCRGPDGQLLLLE